MKTFKFKIVSLLAVSTWLVSCASTSDTQEDAETAVATAIDTPPAVWASLADSSEVPTKWLESFNDPVMLGLIEEGKANNFDLQASAANRDNAVLLAEQAGVALKPNVGLSVGGGGAGTAASGQSNGALNAGVEVSWELDVWGRIRDGVSAAEASLKAAQTDYVFAQYSLSANIAKAYFLVIEAKQQTAITNSNLELLTETLRIVNVQADNNAASAQDVALAVANLAVAQDTLLNVQSSQRNAERSLELLLGRYPDADIDLPDSFPQLPPMPAAGIPSDILERRPDIVSADSRVAAAFNSTSQAQAARLPSISLTGSVNGASNALSSLLDPANVAWQIGANLLAPIFDGGAGRINVEIATVAQRQALANYASTALQAFSDVEQNLDQGLVLANRETQLKVVQEEFAEAYRLTNLRYEAGESALLDVLQIQQQANSANINLLSIQRLQLEQRINLYLALGGSW